MQLFHGHRSLGDRVPAGFDTFQKIQLSLEDEAKSDYSGSNSPLHTSLSGPRRLYHSILEAESTNQHEVAPEEEEEGKDVERFKCHTENTTNLSSDYSCNDVPNLTTTPIRSPRQHVNVPERCTDVTRASEEETSEEFFSPDLMHHENAALDEANGERSLNLCEGDPVLHSTPAGGD
ncbi:hypothetical protein fugu_017958, partial [Takifugu bimaculatus]